MATVHIEDNVYVSPSDIEIDGVEDIKYIMDNNYITIIDILKELNWELPDFQEAARQLDLEYLPMATTGERLYLLFRKLDPVEQREFMMNISNALVSYYGAMPVNELS
jgi:hypothetical protein